MAERTETHANVRLLAHLLELEGDRWRPRRQLDLLSFLLDDRAQVGDASRYIFEYARRRGYDLPPFPLAGCGEIREFFADEGVRSVPEWYEKKLGLDEAACKKLPAQTIIVVRDRGNRRNAFFLDGIRYRNAAAFENLADSGFARTLAEGELGELIGRMLAFLAGEEEGDDAVGTGGVCGPRAYANAWDQGREARACTGKGAYRGASRVF